MTEIEQEKAKEWRRHVTRKYIGYAANIAGKSCIVIGLILIFYKVDGTFQTIEIAALAFLYERIVWGFYFARFSVLSKDMYDLICSENDKIGQRKPEDWPPQHVARLRAYTEMGGNHNINILFSVVFNAIALYNLLRVLI